MTPLTRQQPLRARLQAGDGLLGAILRMPNEALVELVGAVELDFVILDCEHGPADQGLLYAHLLAAGSANVPALVRVSGESHAEILRVLDLGASGIVVPHVDSPPRAAWAVRVAHYPPVGTRGFAVYTRAGGYGLTDARDHLQNAADETITIAMIEDRAGCEQAWEIAGVAGIDALFVGPGDLAVDLGHPGNPGHHAVTAAIAEVHDAARRRDRATMVIVDNETAAQRAYDAGHQLIVYNLQAALTSLLRRLAEVRR